MIGNEAWLIVGKLVAPQGLRGEIRIQPLSEFPERFTKPGKRWIQKTEQEEPQEIKLLGGRQMPGKKIYIVQLKGIDNRSSAQALVGAKLLVPSSDRPKLAEGEFHLLDLMGLEVRLKAEGPSIGEVTNLTNAGNDLLEIELRGGGKALVPFVKPIVPLINLKEGWLMVTPPPGLLEL